MPQAYHILLWRQRRRLRTRRSPAARLGLLAGLFISILLALAFIASGFIYASLTSDLPSLETLPSLLDPPNGVFLQPTRLYDRSGSRVILTLENPAAAGRQYLFLTDSDSSLLPAALISATIATQDLDFWQHPGYNGNWWDTAAAPTLAQRLVSDLLLWEEPASLLRDLRERLLAVQITSHFGREKIMEWYLNSAKYGRWIYGADAAARAYLGKSAVDLTLAEAALLAAVAQAPEIDPLAAPTLVLEHQKQVIQAMQSQGLITGGQASRANSEIITLQPPPSQSTFAAAFTRLALDQLAGQYPLEWLERGGHRLITTLDYGLQVQIECTAQEQVSRLTGQTGGDLAADGLPCQASRLLPTIPNLAARPAGSVNSAIVVYEPASGQLLALGGDSGTSLHTLLGAHPAGTLLTPLVYLTAFTRGVGPASLVWDIPSALPEYDLGRLDPQGVFHGPLRLRNALGNDYITPATTLLEQLGEQEVWRTAQQMGLLSLEEPGQGDRSLLVGGKITLAEAVQAFSVLGNRGALVGQPMGAANPFTGQPALQPAALLFLEDPAGRVALDWRQPRQRLVVSEQLAYLLTHALSDETTRWASLGRPNPLETGRPAGVKIGRTADGSGVWVVGYLPNLAVGVWMGQDTGNSTENAAGREAPPLLHASGLFHALIQYAARDLPPQGWGMPQGITSIRVCDPSGLLDAGLCPAIVGEVFLSGNEPIQSDTLYRIIAINRETGRLATIFTPPHLVEERVFLVVPLQAQAWAQQAGLPTPPDVYDVIGLPDPSPDARLAEPSLFAYVHGEIAVLGSASGDDFSFYRLQVGQGLNPQQWLQITPDLRTPVEDDQLGTWDTNGLSGLFVIQLMIVRQDQRVETASIQVTVDNRPPEIQILAPQADQRFRLADQPVVVLSARCADDLALQSLEFFVDGKRIATLTEEPYLLAWKATPGSHTFRALATDRAGNTSEESVTFSVGE